MTTDSFDLERLASLVKVTRPAFADIFDPLARQHGGWELKLLHLMLKPPPPNQPFLRAFEHAANKGFLEKLVRTLLGAGALHEPDEASSTAPAFVELQKITRPLDGLPDAALDSAAAEKARRRVCSVTVYAPDGRPSYGTGFLIGPQTVLTNWHVVEPLLGADHKPLDGSSRRLHVTFDLFGAGTGKKVEAAQDWLVSHSDAHETEINLPASPYPCVFPGKGFDERLDFAVIRLQKAEGRSRGYYPVASSREPAVQSPVIVFQHPDGERLVRTGGIAKALWPDGIHTRLHHDANTVAGSSGGLVLDNQFELVALHQGGITMADKTLLNAAIPTHCIAKRGRQSGQTFDNVVGVDPMWRIASTGVPVFGRIRFQELLLQAVAGSSRILLVRGGPQSGLSFSRDIMKDRLGLTEHRIVEASAHELPSDVANLAWLLLTRCGAAPASVESLPTFATADTTPDAWLRDVLFPEFMSHLLQAAGPRTVWLVFDDLNKVSLPATSAVSLIQMLLEGVINHDKLRVVLLGQHALASSAPPRYTATEDVSPITADDIVATIGIRAAHVPEQQEQSIDEIRGKAETLYALARDTPGPFLPTLVRYYQATMRQLDQQLA
jgi:hypothetical protein